MHLSRSLLLAAMFAIVCPLALDAQSPSGQDALRIAVIEGEGAVNIIQQKTAVAPMVEVRDRNNQPVAGAIVRFAVTRGRATFAGARTLTVATDVAGRAAVTGLVPTGAGSLQISATAAFQGQSAAVMIAQTNVMTAAEAAAVSGAAGGTSSGSAGGTAGGTSGGAAGGGGLSTTALVVAGAAVAGSAVAAKQVLGGDDKYSGPLNFQMTENYGSCIAVYSFTTTFKMALTIDGTNVSGTANWGGTRNFVSTTCANLPAQPPITNFGWGQHDPTVGGSTSHITFHHEVSNRTDPENFRGDFGEIWDFTGALNGSTITGTADFSNLNMGVVTGRVQIPVNMTKQ
jgi:hypothetical protein